MGGHRVVVVGSVNADLQVRVRRLARPGETLPADGGELWPGGKGANQAVAAALLGARVSIIGAIGTDGRAVPALSGLRDAGVDRSRVAVVPGQTGLAVICIAEDGQNSIYVLPGANGSVTAAQVERSADMIGEAEVVLVQGELPREATEAAMRVAEAAGVRVVLNLAPAGPFDADLIRWAHPLVVNEHEAGHVLGLLGVDSAAACREAGCDPDVCVDPGATGDCKKREQRGLVWAQNLVGRGVRSAVVTLGAAGAVVACNPETVFHLPAPHVQAVDTTGAGDAFVGALVTRLAGDGDLDAATRFAIRAAAYSVQQPGTQASYPRQDADLPE